LWCFSFGIRKRERERENIRGNKRSHTIHNGSTKEIKESKSLGEKVGTTAEARKGILNTSRQNSKRRIKRRKKNKEVAYRSASKSSLADGSHDSRCDRIIPPLSASEVQAGPARVFFRS
jgi:hypothetical protein